MNKQVKRMLALLLALLLAASAGAVAEEADGTDEVIEVVEADEALEAGEALEADEALQEEEAPAQDLHRLRLGSSVYTVMVDDDIVLGEVTEDDVAAGMIACYQNDESGLDMDVYQVSKEGLNQALDHYTLEQANAEERVQVVWPTDSINDIDVGWFWSTKTRDGMDWDTATYILDSGDTYLKLVFWTDNDAAGMEVMDIVYSIDYMSLKQIRLGTSSLTLVVPDDYVLGEISDEDVADDQVAYWYSDASLMDFDVYQFSKEGQPETLAAYAEAEAATYPAVTELVTDGEINMVPVAWYRAVDECDEGEYDTVTYIIDAGEEYLEVVFWLDGPTADAEADFIIHNLIDESLFEADAEEED